MTRGQAGTWMRPIWRLSPALVLLVGCVPFDNAFVLPSFDQIRAPEYPLTFADGPRKGKDVVVALFVASEPGLETTFPLTERILAAGLARKLSDFTKDLWPPQKLSVVDPTLVDKFKLKTPDWKLMLATSCGQKLGADYVMVIRLAKMEFNQPGSSDQLYEGRVDVMVEVYDVDAGPLGPKYAYVHPFKYTHAVSPDANASHRFQKDFLEHLAAEIAMKHVSLKSSTWAKWSSLD
jgi:hypothetical protein